MYTKTIGFPRAHAVFGRSGYYLAADIEAHKTLKFLDRWFLGTDVRGVYSFYHVASAAERRWKRRVGAPREYTYIEVIISTPKGMTLYEGEDRFLAARIVDDFQSTGAMVGAHWHDNGRVDLHVFLLNDNFSGYALGTATILPSTGRAFRNVEVLARQFADAAHLDLNSDRVLRGRPTIPTMDERRDEIYLQTAAEEEQRLAAIVARSEATAQILEKPFMSTAATIAVTAKEPMPTAPLYPPGDVGETKRKKETQVNPSVTRRWSDLTAFLHWWLLSLKELADEERREEAVHKKNLWFENAAKLQLRSEVEEALSMACDKLDESAVECMETLQLARQVLDDRAKEAEKKTRDQGPDFSDFG